MKQPTQEQIKEFWERWGIERQPYGRYGMVRAYPDIDLNSLFRWAVPEAIKLLIKESRTIAPPLEISENIAFGELIAMWLANNPIQFGFETTLFWALWKVKEPKHETT